MATVGPSAATGVQEKLWTLIFPVFASFNSANMGLPDIKSSGDYPLWFVAESNFVNILLREFMPRVGFAFPKVEVQLSAAFFDHVHAIVSLRSQPKVIGVDASGIIATGAVVKNFKAIWDGTHVEDKTCSMGKDCSESTDAPLDFAVTGWPSISRPNPAGFVLCNFCPETLLKGCRKSLRGQIVVGNFDLHSILFLFNCLPSLRMLIHRAGAFLYSPILA